MPSFPADCGTIDTQGCACCSSPCTPSDARLKKGVETLENSLEKLLKLDVVEYDWNTNYNDYDSLEKQGKLHTFGLIAQNVRQYYPEVVSVNRDGYYSVDYIKLNAVLVEAIKEQQVFIDDMDKELEIIKSKLT
jgi:hypothetical protein